MRKLPKAKHPLPTEAELSAEDAQPWQPWAAIAAAVAGFVAAAFWIVYPIIDGRPHLAKVLGDLVHWGEGRALWWNTLSPTAARMYMILAACLLLLVAVVDFVAWLLVWRGVLYPRFMRLDRNPRVARRGEWIGTYVKQRWFTMDVAVTHPGPEGSSPVVQTQARPMVRVYYKHASRLFPLWRYDFLDVLPDNAALPYSFGKRSIRMGRIERDPERGRFARRENPSRFPVARLETAFAEEDIKEDRLRKTAFAGALGSQNPEVMRDKARREAEISEFDILTLDADVRSALAVRERRTAADSPGGNTR